MGRPSLSRPHGSPGFRAGVKVRRDLRRLRSRGFRPTAWALAGTLPLLPVAPSALPVAAAAPKPAGWFPAQSPGTGSTPSGAQVFGVAAVSTAKDPSGERAAGMLQAALHQVLDERATARRVSVAAAFRSEDEAPYQDVLDRARDAAAESRRAYDDLRLDEAIARASQAIALFQEGAAGLRHVDRLTDTLEVLASALTLQGSAAEGVATFAELLTIEPGYAPRDLPRPVEQVFERALDTLRDADSGELEVYSNPPYARVFLDGRFQGTTPLTLPAVNPGTHYLRLEKLGHQSFGSTVKVARRGPTTTQTRLLDLARGGELAELLRRCRRQLPEPGMGPALRELGRRTAADRLIVSAAAQSGEDITYAASVFDMGSGERIGLESRVLPADAPDAFERARTFAARLADLATEPAPDEETRADGTPPGSLPPTRAALTGTGPNPPTPPEVYIGWTLAVLGGAAVVTGSAFAVGALDSHNAFLDTPQNDPELPDVQERGRTQSAVADALLIGGGLSLATGIVLLLVSPQRRRSPRDVSREGASVLPTGDGATVRWRTSF